MTEESRERVLEDLRREVEEMFGSPVRVLRPGSQKPQKSNDRKRRRKAVRAARRKNRA